MSEALSSSEIEDVLSSIRRLVSDDIRPVGAGQRPSPRPGDEGDKLLLTPALRVVQPGDAAKADQPRAIDDVVAAVSAGVAQQADDWEPETGDLADAAPMAENVEEDWADAPAVAAYAEAVPEPVTDPVSEAETVVEFLHHRATEAVVEPAEAAFESALPQEPVDEAQLDSRLPGWAQTDGAEEADAPRPEPWAETAAEPDRAWADEAEAAILQELTGAAPAMDSTAEVMDADDADDMPEAPVDEAMLREIVRDVLREELQGPLGERITRNIRKLVRAEIARVMATEQLL